MDTAEVIYLLKLQGKTQRTIANQLGVTHGAVNNTLHRRCKNREVACAIADAIGLPLTRVFPDQYPLDR